MFAGSAARDFVIEYLNTIENAMNLERNSHTAYDNLRWGIEAKTENGQV